MPTNRSSRWQCLSKGVDARSVDEARRAAWESTRKVHRVTTEEILRFQAQRGKGGRRSFIDTRFVVLWFTRIETQFFLENLVSSLNPSGFKAQFTRLITSN